MLKDSLTTRLLIRLCILALTAIGPLSILYILLRLLAPPYSGLGAPPSVLVLDAYCLAEALFLLLVYLPRKWWINRPAAPYAPLKTREQRREMLQRTWDATPDPRRDVEMYFYGVPLEELRRGDVRRWLLWRVWGKVGGEADRQVLVDEAELEEYVRYSEDVLGYRFEDGDGGFQSMAVTVEPVGMARRPLLWYAIIAGVDLIAFVGMWWQGFHFRGRSAEVVKSFPFRPLAFFGRRSPTGVFGYWYREHTPQAKDVGRLPVLFVHGIGVGLYFYQPFLADLTARCRKNGVGLIALELLAVCNRMTAPLPTPDEVADGVVQILDHHGWEKCVLVTHSYGSAVAAHMMRHPTARTRIGSMVFVDPVAFSFHPPDVAWNFLRRSPRTASQWQLWYFASMDPDVARTLTRNFRWFESSLWREDMDQHTKEDDGSGKAKVTVMLSGADIITDVTTLGEYLTREPTEQKWYHQRKARGLNQSWQARAWTGEQALEVVFVPDLNHAEIFEEQASCSLLSRIAETYTLP